MNITAIMATKELVLKFGGPGSGCHGDNCGRPSLSPKDISSYKTARNPESVTGKAKYSASEQKALNYYKSEDGYFAINKMLYSDGHKPRLVDKVKEIDSAIKKNGLTQNVSLFKFAQLGPKTKEQFANLKANDTFVLKGYQSTTTSPQELRDLTDEADFLTQSNVAFKILAPSGSDVATFGYMSGGDDEKEILLPRGSTFSVVENHGLQSKGLYSGSVLLTLALRPDKPEPNVKIIVEKTSKSTEPEPVAPTAKAKDPTSPPAGMNRQYRSSSGTIYTYNPKTGNYHSNPKEASLSPDVVESNWRIYAPI